MVVGLPGRASCPDLGFCHPALLGGGDAHAAASLTLASEVAAAEAAATNAAALTAEAGGRLGGGAVDLHACIREGELMVLRPDDHEWRRQVAVLSAESLGLFPVKVRWP